MLTNSGRSIRDELPAAYRGRIEAALLVAREALLPAPVTTFAVAMDDLFGWAETFGVVAMPEVEKDKEKRISSITKRYRADLGDIPADLIVLAVRRLTATLTFRNLPLPGDLRREVADELGRRRALLTRLEIAQRFGRFSLTPAPEVSIRSQPAARLARLPGSESPEADERPPVSRAEAARRHAAIIQG